MIEGIPQYLGFLIPSKILNDGGKFEKNYLKYLSDKVVVDKKLSAINPLNPKHFWMTRMYPTKVFNEISKRYGFDNMRAWIGYLFKLGLKHGKLDYTILIASLEKIYGNTSTDQILKYLD